MRLEKPDTVPVATLDVCLDGVFVARGEPIPVELRDAWRRRLLALGLEKEGRSFVPGPESLL